MVRGPPCAVPFVRTLSVGSSQGGDGGEEAGPSMGGREAAQARTVSVGGRGRPPTQSTLELCQRPPSDPIHHGDVRGLKGTPQLLNDWARLARGQTPPTGEESRRGRRATLSVLVSGSQRAAAAGSPTASGRRSPLGTRCISRGDAWGSPGSVSCV